MAKPYTIGLDFGTLSVRALLVEAENGRVAASCSRPYAHGVMESNLPNGRRLPADFALQHPRDYLDAMTTVIRGVVKEGAVRPEQVIGLGCDFTQCTMMPIKEDGTPLCFLPEYEGEPHAYVKLWKHHAAQPEADRINRTADPALLAPYGGKISSEWMFPKLLEIYLHAPQIYAAADEFVELTDWIPRVLTGSTIRSGSIASVAAMWSPHGGYPPEEFLGALAPGFERVVRDKLPGQLAPIGSVQGRLKQDWAQRLGLAEGMPVAVGCGDSHSAVCGAGIVSEGRMLMVLGTSGCDMVASREEHLVPGLCGICYESMLPGHFGYEAGQPCIGDLMQWFLGASLPDRYRRAAEEAGLSVYDYLNRLAEPIPPGRSGLLALDWWNGNRSVYMDADLSGLMVGMTMATRPEEIYQALIQAVAFGKRRILDGLTEGGVPVHEVLASGGIASKNPYFMQVMADILNRPIAISEADNASCMGAAVLGAVAAGPQAGGYEDIIAAGTAMCAARPVRVYQPHPSPVYEELYGMFCQLSEQFAHNGLMRRLKALREEKEA